MFAKRALKPAKLTQTVRQDWRTIVTGAFAPLASFAMFHMVTVFPLSWVFLFTRDSPVRFLAIEALSAVPGMLAIVISGYLADRFGRRAVLGATAAAIAAFSGFAPQLLDAGEVGEAVFMVTGFVLLGFSFGQSSGALSSSFSPRHRYTGSALTSDLAWLFGAGFAPLVALWLSSEFGLFATGAYLLSGAVGTMLALALNRELARAIE
jgi:MFS family permease